jgi:hypothetical protein
MPSLLVYTVERVRRKGVVWGRVSGMMKIRGLDKKI